MTNSLSAISFLRTIDLENEKQTAEIGQKNSSIPDISRKPSYN